MTDQTLKIHPHKGPQETYLASGADIAIYGGAAGGGKTWALLAEPLRHIGNSGFGAVIFRRTYPQITGQGGLWDEAANLYPMIGGTLRQTQMDVAFPSGSRISFRHLEHEKTKLDWQGTQIPLIEFDEMTHFTETQFFYLLSRNRSLCGVRPYVRGTCNPDAGSWVAKFISWWIDQDSGYPIQQRSGVVRWFVRLGDDLHWGDRREELTAQFPDLEPKSMTFVPSRLEDNPTLMEKDPGYRANLMSLPRIERERLLGGNWKVSELSVIEPFWIRTFSATGDTIRCIIGCTQVIADARQCRRFATIDTAGTSRELAEDRKGKPPSWSVCGIWDYYHREDVLFLRHVWRGRVGWNELKVRVPEVLNTWHCPRVYVENAHFGPALASEITGRNVELIGPVIPGMAESHRGAKLERAIASGFLSRIEDGRLLIPDEDFAWIVPYRNELIAWGGLPDETADQIDMSSYGAYVSRRQMESWGGVLGAGGMRR